MTLYNKNLLNIIEKIVPSAEAKLFIESYQALPKIHFAVIYINKQTLSSKIQVVAEAIAMMNQLDLFPLLVLEEYSLDLEKQIIRAGGNSAVLKEPYYLKEENGEARVEFNIQEISEFLESKITPIICLQETLSFKYLEVSSEFLAEELVKILKSKKYIYLTKEGFIPTREGAPWSFINLEKETDYSIFSHEWLVRIQKFAAILKDLSDCAVVVTSADKLLKEIFTIKGNGTFIKSHEIKAVTGFSSLDKEKIKLLLEDSFKKSLKADFFEGDFEKIYFQPDYEGVAFIQKLNGFYYLDKFAVGKKFQGTGLGKSIWNKLLNDYPSLIWRAVAGNPLNKFYLKECDGCVKYQDWHIYWKNLDLEVIFPTIQIVQKKKASFSS